MQRLLAGSFVLKYKTLESTNDFCKDYYRQMGNSAFSAAVWTVEQSKGKGQRGNGWHAEPGKNLTFSVICDSSFLNPDELFYLNKAVSVAIIAFLNEIAIKAEIKWPNDIYYKNEKLAGILIESSINGPKLLYSVIGIGLNINETNFPKELKATSLKLISGKEFNLEDCLDKLLNHLDNCLWKVKQQKKQLDEAYFNHLLGLNSMGIFEDEHGVFGGTIKNVTENGLLQIETNHTLKNYNFKEVKFLF